MKKASPSKIAKAGFQKLRRQDLNLRPRGYEPRELPGCSTPRRDYTQVRIHVPRVNPHFLEKLLKTISACFLQRDYLWIVNQPTLLMLVKIHKIGPKLNLAAPVFTNQFAQIFDGCR